ncbi:MAG: bifunctional diaminohydroxyphosphoribosylaminopyrimidine deaminase/5-amino-6-(5-phosphoribosylamino)uracil reductase RibD [Verrucomicrobiales bacterium]|nr:bifunctional diaminohydroxyphosphoribosylaminopyrimidine deaminase/5-amino-6-(5-phosphoribosylamino)uracil reductase RibD [Verrucomicrobiales bacterium]MCP5526476.1 bifunctional diaminohydroxyphosphoribosylaminopyrimidine deaminase/5-amino-6-(5-phosphoribosylamino)uracil reductase RibD [Verrucomicrobiales bacterium]
MRLALRLARRGYGLTSPNPMVGAVLVRRGDIIGQGWHRRTGLPHAEIEALQDAAKNGQHPRDATLYVTLEPCSTHGRTPPCTEAVLRAEIRRVVVAATDPNPAHAGRGLDLLRRQGVQVTAGLLGEEAARLNEAFNHWIVQRTPFVTLKVAMTLDGKIATRTGESRWITGPAARRLVHRWRQGADAILVGIKTVLADDPALTVRRGERTLPATRQPRRIVLDTSARTPLTSRLLDDAFVDRTLVVVGERAPARRVKALSDRANVWMAPAEDGLDLRWLLKRLGGEDVTHLFVEGGGEVHAAFLRRGLAQRFLGFYAPLVIGGKTAPRAIAGPGATDWPEIQRLHHLEVLPCPPDLGITGLIEPA